LVDSSQDLDESSEGSLDDLKVEHIKQQKGENVEWKLRPSRSQEVKEYRHQDEENMGVDFSFTFLRVRVETDLKHVTESDEAHGQDLDCKANI
jgi:hypothetical protein